MKILWLISSGWREGGAESNLCLMRPIFEQKGHTVKILSSDTHPEKPHFNDYSFHAHEGIFKNVFHTINPSAYVTLKKILKEFQPDVVHVHTIGYGSPALLFPLKKHPTLLTMHGPEGFIKSLLMLCFPTSYFRNGEHDEKNLNIVGKIRRAYHHLVMDPLYALGFRNIDTIISPSHYMQKLVAKDGYKSVYLPNGTALLEYHPVHRDALTHTLLYVGRLEKLKGVDYLLRAMPSILEKFPDTQLLIAGDGNEKINLEHLAQELSIDHAVTFLGFVNHEKLQELYERAMLVVMPSVCGEAFGLVGIEAMSAGRPVIASDVGGISDWLQNAKTGFLVPPKDPSAIARAVIQLFSSPDLLLQMMHNARKRSEEFDLEKHVNRLLELYNDTVTAKS